MKLRRIIIAATACVVLVAIAITGTALYLTDNDSATNTVTVGDVKVDLTEPNWEDTENVVPNQELPKDPQVTNTGINDALVYLTLQVPVENITLTADDGTKGTKAKNELFFGGEESVYSQVGGDDLFWGFKHNWRHYFSFMHELHSGIVNDYALWGVIALALAMLYAMIIL